MSEAAEKPAQAPAPAPGGSKKLLSMVLIFNVVIAGGLAYLVLAGRAQPAPAKGHIEHAAEGGKEGEGKEGEEGEAEAEGEGKGDKTKGAKFGPLLEVGSFVANLSTPQGAAPRYAKVTLHVEVSNEETKAAVEAGLVPLRAEALMYLSSAKPEDIVGQEKIHALCDELIKRFNALLGRKAVRRVYFSDLVVQ
jgi:flagellar basal body-associated protein FliL